MGKQSCNDGFIFICFVSSQQVWTDGLKHLPLGKIKIIIIKKKKIRQASRVAQITILCQLSTQVLGVSEGLIDKYRTSK